MRYLYLAGIVLFAILPSCEDNTQSEPFSPALDEFQSETFIRQIGATEEFMQVITYYETTLVAEHLERFSYRKFLYNDNNQLEKIEVALTLNPLSCAIIPGTSFEDGDDPRKAKVGQYTTFEYDDDSKLKRKNFYYINEDNATLLNYELFEYNNGKIIKTEVFNPQDQLNYFYTYIYSNDNVAEENYYYFEDATNAVLQSKKRFIYDNKKNPFIIFKVEGTPGINTNKNNISKEIYTSYYNDEEYTDSILHTYEYNSLGYPVMVDNQDYIYGEEN